LQENVAFALEVCGKNQSKINKIVASVMKIVGLQNKMNRYPHEVSGGEQQRAAIARALVHQPKILLADEPTGNLDPYHSKDIINLLEKINDLGTTIILSTHDKAVINGLKRRVVTLDRGEIVRDEQIGRFIL